jgi:hypothetical protein
MTGLDMSNMNTTHDVNVTYSTKTPISANKAFQVIVGVAAIVVALKMFWAGMFSGLAFGAVGYQKPIEGMGSGVALAALVIDTVALVGTATITVFTLLWGLLGGVVSYWRESVNRGKAIAENNPLAAQIGVAAAVGSVASEVANAASQSGKPRKTVEERLLVLNGNDKEFKRITDDHASRLEALELTTGLRQPPPPAPPSVEEQLLQLQAKLAELEETKTPKRGATK